MRSHTSLQCFLTVIILWFVNMGSNVQTQRLSEGKICLKGSNSSSNYICKNINNCPAVAKQKNANNYAAKACSNIGTKKTIVCCPPTPELTETSPTTINPITTAAPPITLISNRTYSSAAEMCTIYSKLINRQIRNPIYDDEYMLVRDCFQDIATVANGKVTHPKEFPHMALLGYNETPDNRSWLCGGSLISERFVLTAAHCEKINDGYVSKKATWARLGDLDYLSDIEEARPQDYKIELRVIHPQYKDTSHYHDIALFRLDRDVEFSPFVRPICLNTDNSFNPSEVIVTGWGVTGNGENVSSRLLKANINTISVEKCNKNLSTLKNKKQKLSNGIIDDFMICSVVKDGKDSCEGDSGGPIQILRSACMYSQIGITSFGTFCGEDLSSGVYTRVSYYIPWIEKTVWPIIGQNNRY